MDLRWTLFFIFFLRLSFVTSSSVSRSLSAKSVEGPVTLRLTQSWRTTSSTVRVGSMRARTVTPSLVVTLFVGTSPGDFDGDPLAGGDASVVRLLLGDMDVFVCNLVADLLLLLLLTTNSLPTRWLFSLDMHRTRPPLRSIQPSLDACFGTPCRSPTPPISPPASTTYGSKRSGMTFALVPAEVGGQHVFTHVVVNHQDHDCMDSSPLGLPEDMQDVVQQLDDLATWVRAASLGSRVRSIRPFPHKGKDPATPPNNGCATVVCTAFLSFVRLLNHPGVKWFHLARGFHICAQCMSGILHPCRFSYPSYSAILQSSSSVVPTLPSHTRSLVIPASPPAILILRTQHTISLTTGVFLSVVLLPHTLHHFFLLPLARPPSGLCSSAPDPILLLYLLHPFPRAMSLLRTRCVTERECVCLG